MLPQVEVGPKVHWVPDVCGAPKPHVLGDSVLQGEVVPWIPADPKGQEALHVLVSFLCSLIMT